MKISLIAAVTLISTASLWAQDEILPAGSLALNLGAPITVQVAPSPGGLAPLPSLNLSEAGMESPVNLSQSGQINFSEGATSEGVEMTGISRSEGLTDTPVQPILSPILNSPVQLYQTQGPIVVTGSLEIIEYNHSIPPMTVASAPSGSQTFPLPADSASSLQPVPEPSTLALGGLAFGLIGMVRRKRGQS
jgi:PEP-CTERM motif